jgi:hypothetical protein
LLHGHLGGGGGGGIGGRLSPGGIGFLGKIGGIDFLGLYLERDKMHGPTNTPKTKTNNSTLITPISLSVYSYRLHTNFGA